MKLSVSTLANGLGVSIPESFDYSVLGRLKTDEKAISETEAALRKGMIVREEIPYIMSRVIEAVLAKEGHQAKMNFYPLFESLVSAATATGVVSEELHDPKKLRDVIAKLNDVGDNLLQAAQRYEDLFWLAVISPNTGKMLDDQTKGKAISAGAVLARADDGRELLDGMFRDVAGRCLDNALANGGLWTRLHAAEVLGSYYGRGTEKTVMACLSEIMGAGTVKEIAFAAVYLEKRFGIDAKDAVLDCIWQGEGDSRKSAIEAFVRLFGGDKAAVHSLAVMAEKNNEIKREVSLMAKGSDEALSKLAGSVMAQVRNRDELDSAVQDRKFLCEDILQDPTTPQRAYVECVFDAVERVLGSRNGSSRTTEYQVALKQLASFGADPGAMKDLLDSHTLKLVRRNVENALLHAVAKSEFGEIAAAGLEKIGSDRVEEILERIVAREGEKSACGLLASETLERIRGRKVEETMEFIPPVPKKTPPKDRRERLLQ
jgi:hypothetical protein